MADLSKYDQFIAEAAEQHGVDEDLIRAIILQESSGNPQAKSGAGAVGLMGLMPATARSLGVKNPLDPRENILGGTKYLSSLLQRFKELPLALAAYNAGPSNVVKHGGIPPFRETRNYVSKILGASNVGLFPKLSDEEVLAITGQASAPSEILPGIPSSQQAPAPQPGFLAGLLGGFGQTASFGLGVPAAAGGEALLQTLGITPTTKATFPERFQESKGKFQEALLQAETGSPLGFLTGQTLATIPAASKIGVQTLSQLLLGGGLGGAQIGLGAQDKTPESVAAATAGGALGSAALGIPGTAFSKIAAAKLTKKLGDRTSDADLGNYLLTTFGLTKSAKSLANKTLDQAIKVGNKLEQTLEGKSMQLPSSIGLEDITDLAKFYSRNKNFELVAQLSGLQNKLTSGDRTLTLLEANRLKQIFEGFARTAKGTEKYGELAKSYGKFAQNLRSKIEAGSGSPQAVKALNKEQGMLKDITRGIRSKKGDFTTNLASMLTAGSSVPLLLFNPKYAAASLLGAGAIKGLNTIPGLTLLNALGNLLKRGAPLGGAPGAVTAQTLTGEQ